MNFYNPADVSLEAENFLLLIFSLLFIGKMKMFFVYYLKNIFFLSI